MLNFIKMFGVTTINWKNSAENLLITLITFIFGVFIGHLLTYKTQNEILEQLKPTIEKAIDKETISNTINNAIDLKIDKIKKSDSLKIVVNQKPTNDQKPENILIKKNDTIKKKKKKKFLWIF